MPPVLSLALFAALAAAPAEPPPAASVAEPAAAPNVATAAPAAQEAATPPNHKLLANVPHYKADLGVDLGADTFLFRHGQTGFALELSPRVSFILSRYIDAGFYMGLGYGGPIPEWSQMTTFGVGGFANASLPLLGRLSVNPWVGVMYHYAFIEGYADPLPSGTVVAFPHQSVRIDLHGDLSYRVSKFSSMNFGVYCKTRLAPVSEGPGTADQLSYGLRVSAVTAF